MQKIKSIVRTIIPFFKNFYFSSIVILLLWLAFFDANDFVSQFRLSGKLSDLESEKRYFISKIEEVKFERKEVIGSNYLLEKFARERYLMKKPTEDIYILSKK